MFTVTVDVSALERATETRWFFTAEVVYSNSIVHRYRFEHCSLVRDRRGTVVVFGPSVRVAGRWQEVVTMPFDVRNEVQRAVLKKIAEADHAAT
jgi:hypothetical protein